MDKYDLSPAAFLDLSKSIAAPIFSGIDRVWEAIARIEAFVLSLVANPPEGYERVGELVIAHREAKIAASAELLGPAVIGRGAEVGPGAWIRAFVLMGDFSVAGHASELKNCILFDGALAAHFNYVGDSILGSGSHLGAGALLSNQRSDKAEVVFHGPGELAIPTGLAKFGSVLGDGVEIGCNAVCFPGTLIGRGSTVYPLAPVRGYVPPFSIVKEASRVVSKREAAARG
ncbi:MAG TPA: hypothetical protein VMV83_02955 [Rectinemataceae bacterium]|nr:hypothetical protein [Rectinemataceae bacterium]